MQQSVALEKAAFQGAFHMAAAAVENSNINETSHNIEDQVNVNNSKFGENAEFIFNELIMEFASPRHDLPHLPKETGDFKDGKFKLGEGITPNSKDAFLNNACVSALKPQQQPIGWNDFGGIGSPLFQNLSRRAYSKMENFGFMAELPLNKSSSHPPLKGKAAPSSSM